MTNEDVKRAASDFVDGLLGSTQAETDMKNTVEAEKEIENEELEKSGLMSALASNGQNITEERENIPVHNNDRNR